MGVKQWIFQRFCNAIFALLGLWLLFTIIADGGFSYDALRSILENPSYQWALIGTLLLIGLNSILAGWQITGDYAEKFGINAGLMNGTCVLVSVAYVAAGISFLL